jgi:Prophage antirepressor
MQFEKRNFMGIELDVLTGHPDHDLLFVANQVARAAGLKDPKSSVQLVKMAHGNVQAKDLKVEDSSLLEVLKAAGGGRRWADSWMFTEANVYRMLMRANTDKALAFQKWLSEEVLPTIRKTGKYNAEDSTNPIAQGVMDELKTLRGEVGELKSLIEIMMARPLVVSESAPASVSTYLCPEVHTEFVWRHFDRKLLIKLCDMQKLSVPVADKLKAAVMVKLEVALLDLWNATDARKLQTELSGSTKRPWAGFPQKHMNQGTYAVCMNGFKNPHY